MRITKEGEPVRDGNILSNIDPLNKYYAYGIRNSFGMDFDPVIGKLWDKENGDRFGDEINLVEPGFNSGYMKILGIWKEFPFNENMPGDIAQTRPEGLVDFGGKGKYSFPEFTWSDSVGPIAMKFLNSDKLGKLYKNDMFVGDFGDGNIYLFELNEK